MGEFKEDYRSGSNSGPQSVDQKKFEFPGSTYEGSHAIENFTPENAISLATVNAVGEIGPGYEVEFAKTVEWPRVESDIREMYQERDFDDFFREEVPQEEFASEVIRGTRKGLTSEEPFYLGEFVKGELGDPNGYVWLVSTCQAHGEELGKIGEILANEIYQDWESITEP